MRFFILFPFVCFSLKSYSQDFKDFTFPNYKEGQYRISYYLQLFWSIRARIRPLEFVVQ